MNPNQGQEEQNPYLQALAQARGQQGGQPQGGAPSGMAGMMAAQGAMGPQQGGQPSASMMQPATPPSTTRGQTGDVTKPLIQAASAIHTFLAQATDKEDIAMGRSIISLLSQLVMKDQQKAGQMDQQLEQQMQGMQGGQPPTGQMGGPQGV